jgi:hypothetical protein
MAVACSPSRFLICKLHFISFSVLSASLQFALSQHESFVCSIRDQILLQPSGKMVVNDSFDSKDVGKVLISLVSDHPGCKQSDIFL